MSDFEKVIKMDPSREDGNGYEKPMRIEKEDKYYFAAEFTYNPPELVENMSPAMQEKYYKAKKIEENTQIIDIRDSTQHKENYELHLGEFNEKSKSKKAKGRPKKTNPKLHWSTVEDI